MELLGTQRYSQWLQRNPWNHRNPLKKSPLDSQVLPGTLRDTRKSLWDSQGLIEPPTDSQGLQGTSRGSKRLLGTQMKSLGSQRDSSGSKGILGTPHKMLVTLTQFWILVQRAQSYQLAHSDKSDSSWLKSQVSLRTLGLIGTAKAFLGRIFEGLLELLKFLRVSRSSWESFGI